MEQGEEEGALYPLLKVGFYTWVKGEGGKRRYSADHPRPYRKIEGEERIRIISARKASKKEGRQYLERRG